MGENTHQNCTRQNKNKEDPGRQQPCRGSLFCTNLTQPTGNLDSRSSDEIVELLKLSNKRYKQTIVMITHNLEIAKIADRILRIEDGRMTEAAQKGL